MGTNKNTKKTNKVNTTTVEQTVEPNGVTVVQLTPETTEPQTTPEPIPDVTSNKWVVGSGFGSVTINCEQPLTIEQLMNVFGVGYSTSGFTPVIKVHNNVPKGITVTHKSTCENPVKTVLNGCEELVNKGYTRKQIIEHFVNMGISYHTVRTQYQVWYGLNKHGVSSLK